MKARRGIRWHLLQIQLASIVPIGLLAAALLYLHWQVQERERQRAQMESARLVAAAVDNALDSTVARLSIFARLWTSSALSNEMIYDQAKAALGGNRDWENILAIAPDGRTVFRADAAFGPLAPSGIPRGIWEPVFAGARPVVSDVFIDSERTVPRVAVGVPVLGSNGVAYALIATLEPGWYDRLLNRPGAPPGAVAALIDRRYKFIARSIEGDSRRGGDPTPALVADMKLRREGLGQYVNLNGTSVYTTWTDSRSGWHIGFATPSAPVQDAFLNHLVVFGLMWVTAVGAGFLHASSKAASIASALESLEGQAQHFATGERITELPGSQVHEIDRVLLALERASELLQSATQQRDASLETERGARAAAEAANHAKDEFLAMLGHELRNPLAAISTAVTIAKSDRRTDAQLAFATDVIERQSVHLKRLIDDLLDVGRAMTGKILLARVPLDLAATVRRTVAMLKAAGRLAERCVELETASVWVNGDPTRIEQILTNLLVNAERYTSPDGRIRVRVARDHDRALLEVTDDGRGIATADLPRVFDLFFQAEPTADRAAGGLGLGLTLVQRLATLHGGQVEAHSRGRGHGARFCIHLPAIAPPDTPAAGATPTAHSSGEPVLVVEDNPDARESLSLALELIGYRVLRAADGFEALTILESARPRVAILDIGLPGMDGYELAKRVRGELGARIGLLALTGYGAAERHPRAADARFDHYLTKPVDVDALAQLIEQTCAKVGVRSESPRE